ncbi:MAG: NUDIX domain-containing protein [Anaeroplasmataceae bacterium]|nr:NUDIX domain-containing protein [Anaeroplasmataceae bacterium]
MEIKFYKDVKEKISFVVIVARYKDSFVFCKHKDRTSFEIPGGHIETGETILEAAKRELEEETGALKYTIDFVSFYSYNSYGALYYAEIEALGQLNYEIESLHFCDYLPENLTYPMIQPRLFNYVIQNHKINFGSNFKRMLAGALYNAGLNDPELHRNAVRKAMEYNQTGPEELEKRKEMIRGLFGSTKEHFYIEPSIRMDYGFNIHIGDYFYANFDCVFLDVAPIVFGDHVFVAPRCCFYTAGHPIDADIRNEELEYGYPIRVGSNVWFGGSVVVNPGVTIGSNVVIGSGSVVTKDIPDGVVACGNPCKVIRKITEEDKRIWQERKNFFSDDIFK